MSSQFASRIPEMIRNLSLLYRARTPQDDALGRAWYPNAHRIVTDWSDSYQLPIATVASVIAAISPQCVWERNLILADDVLAERAPSVYGALPANLAKAQRIRANRATDITAYFKSGPKVSSFACNLAGDWDIVTVDTHAAQAALNDVESTVSLKPTVYADFAEAYRHAAWGLDILPAHFQATIWHMWKRLYPRSVKLTRRRQWHVISTEV